MSMFSTERPLRQGKGMSVSELADEMKNLIDQGYGDYHPAFVVWEYEQGYRSGYPLARRTANIDRITGVTTTTSTSGGEDNTVRRVELEYIV